MEETELTCFQLAVQDDAKVAGVVRLGGAQLGGPPCVDPGGGVTVSEDVYFRSV